MVDSLLLTQRNVYILPTGAGWMLAVTLVVLLIASMNYQLNLGFLLTFLLAGSAVVGMHISHATLRGLTLHLKTPEPHFLGQAATLEVQLHNPSTSIRYGIGVCLQPEEPEAGSSARQHHSKAWVWTDVAAQNQSSAHVAFQPARRGRHAVPLLSVETRFPLGTFRVWSIWRPTATVLVYPRPESPAPPLPAGIPSTGGTGQINSQGVGEFDGVRAYRRGDPLKLVVWKKAAKTSSADTGNDDLISRDSQQSQRLQLWLDIQQTGLPEHEARLSRLTAWVLQADQLGIDYGLRLAGTEIAPDQGYAHRTHCLEVLALC
jgi:uncharacterized protein (DUF58 family)